MTSKRPPRPRRRSPDRIRSHSDERSAPALRYTTIVVANLGKLIGFGIAVNEMVIRDNARNSVIAFCALCVLGTQAAEDAFLKLIDRLFTQEEG
jgi:hypothetical protein